MHSIWGEQFVPEFGPKDGFGIRPGEDVLGLDEEERALWADAYTDPQRAVIQRQRDERRWREHQEREKERERKSWPTSTAGQLLKKLGECFAEYRECLEKDPRLMDKALEFDEMNQKIFNRMRTSMDRAHNAPRCRHEKAGGGRAARRECAERSIAICTRCWKRRVRRRSICRAWEMRTRSMRRLPKERRPWWMESWSTSRRQYWGITCNWH